MNLSSDALRTAFKQKLRDRYEHLTEEDLNDVHALQEGWVDRLHRRVGGPLFALAHLAEEVAVEHGVAAPWKPRKCYERTCA